MEYVVVVSGRMIVLERGDITTKNVDAIVNAANSGLMGGGGVDGAIHRAGGPLIHKECLKIVAEKAHLPAGKAVVTSGSNLPSRFVIHTVGPVWHGGGRGEAVLLASAYKESLQLAETLNIETVAFPSISTGAYGYPVDRAARVALATVRDHLIARDTRLKKVTFVLFDDLTLREYKAAADNVLTEN